MKNLPQTSLFDPSTVATPDEQQQEILRRLGVHALPAHETRWLPLARILVPDEPTVRVPASLVRSIKLMGVLQPPSVVRCSPAAVDEDHAMYQVIAGRRRVKAARQARLSMLQVEVYTSSTPQLSALLALSENVQRSAAWVKEVADLRLLIDRRVALTSEDLVACGFTRAGLTERLKMAQLPDPLLDQIISGKVSLEVARKLIRLTPEHLARLTQLAHDEPLTAQVVKQALHAQIVERLPPAQIPLATAEHALSPNAPLLSAPEDTSPPDLPSIDQVLATLGAFTRSVAYQHLEDVHLLLEALMQRLERARHDYAPTPSVAGCCSSGASSPEEHSNLFLSGARHQAHCS